MPTPPITIAPLTAADQDAVRAIYDEGIADGNATFETAAPTWEAWDAGHLPACRLVARAGDDVVGWVALSPVSGRCVYGGVAELSIYVARRARGRGVGGALLAALVEASEQAGIWTVQAGVFPENHASLAVCRAHGFRVVGVRERLGRQGDRWRDVVLLERRSARVGGPAPAAPPVAAEIVEVTEGRGALCRRILDALPAWFGIPEAVDDYVRGVETLPTYAVEVAGARVGLVALREHLAASAEIYVMGVLPAHHRRGLGRLLIGAALDHARRRGLRLLTVKTLGPSRPNDEYARTRAFYAAAGFVPVEELPLWGPTNPCLIMARPVELASPRG